MQLTTPEWLDKYKELVASGLSQRQACAILGIARATVYDTLLRVEQQRLIGTDIPDSKEDNSVVLVISDMHIPYHHPKMLDWLQALKDKYKPTRVICIGDELDKHALSYHDSDPNLKSAGDELSESLGVIKKLHEMFPVMDILESNHGSLIS